MLPKIYYYLGVEANRVYVRYKDSERGKEKHRTVRSIEDFARFIRARMVKFRILSTDDLIVMCSSSMDFPKEYTKDKKVIALARALRQ